MINRSNIDELDNIREGLKSPYYAIEDALAEPYAEKIRSELLRTNLWHDDNEDVMSEKQGQRVSDEFKYSRKGITLGGQTGLKGLDDLFRYLNSAEFLSWISDMSGRKCDFFEGSATIFRPGDHISRHTDCYSRTLPNGVVQSRAVTFNYWLTKNWRPEWGGRLVWEKPYAEIIPTFNTLILFLPTEASNHWVETVNVAASEPRLAISGWFMTERTYGDNQLNIK